LPFDSLLGINLFNAYLVAVGSMDKSVLRPEQSSTDNNNNHKLFRWSHVAINAASEPTVSSRVNYWIKGVTGQRGRHRGQKGIGVSNPHGLYHSQLCVQASNLLIPRPYHFGLCLGIIGQAVQIVGLLVSFNSGHAVHLTIEKTPPPREGWGFQR